MPRALVVLVLAALVCSALLVLSLGLGSPPSGAVPVSTVLQVRAGLAQHPAAWIGHTVFVRGILIDLPQLRCLGQRGCRTPQHLVSIQNTLVPVSVTRCPHWSCSRFTVQWGGSVPFGATVACPTCSATATDFVLQQPGSAAILPLSRSTALAPAPAPVPPLLTVLARLPLVGQEQPTPATGRLPYGWGVYPLAIVRQGQTLRLALADPRY